MNHLTSISTLQNKEKSSDKLLLAFFGHHKAASSSIVSILSDVCAEMGFKKGNYNNPKMFDLDLKQTLLRDKIDFLLYRSVDYNYVKSLENFKGFHVVRDPRDIVVSAYFSHLHSHPLTKHWPQLVPHREKLQKVSKDEGIFLEMEFRRMPFEKMYDWNYCLSNVLELKMEDLFKDSQKQFVKIFDFLGILDKSSRDPNIKLNPQIVKTINRTHFKSKGLVPMKLRRNKISETRLIEIVEENSFAKKAKGRKKGQENIKSHYRKGVSRDWENHLKPGHILFFKDNYNDLLLKLDYESNPNWWKNYL